MAPRVSSACLPPRRPRTAFVSAVILAALGVCACSNSCFVGFSNNGNGGLIIAAGSPPPTCSLMLTHGMVRVKVVPTVRCAFCLDTVRAEHLYVALRGLQLHAGAIADADSADWVELAPHLADEPLPMDLVSAAGQEIFVGSSLVPAGSYRQVRLQFAADRPGDDGRAESHSGCAASRRNCAVRADGSEATIYWPGGLPEVVVRGQSATDDGLTVLPDTTVDLLISLEPRSVDLLSSGGRWMSEEVLIGRVASVR